jgi:hypothetical protein
MTFNPQPKKLPVLLKGRAHSELRRECCEKAGSRCSVCDRFVPLSSNSGDPLFTNGHMSHVRPRKISGDVIENVVWKCFHCHIEREHIEGKI